jgi:phage terminase large subunit-like protein
LIADITTAGDDRTSIGYEKQEELKKILEGTYTDEQTFGVIYTISEKDREAFTEALALDDPYPAVEPIIRKANPNYDVSVSADYYKSRVNDAQKKQKDKNKFQTKHLNVWINAMDNYFTMTEWINECDQPEVVVPALFKGKPCYLHLDMSSKKDICSLMALFRCGQTADGKNRFAAFGHHFLPEAVVSENMVGRRAEYNAWSENGRFVLTPGNVTDYQTIKDYIKQYNNQFNVIKIGFDDWNSIQLNDDLRKIGMNGVEIKQRTKNLSEPMKTLESYITYRRPSEDGKGDPDPRILHNGDPVLRWAMSNVVAKEDANENVYPRKDHQDAKIDPAVALINLFALERLEALPSGKVSRRVPKVWTA